MPLHVSCAPIDQVLGAFKNRVAEAAVIRINCEHALFVRR
jgi:hypothetical protein